MTLKSTVIPVFVSLTFAFACGSSDHLLEPSADGGNAGSEAGAAGSIKHTGGTGGQSSSAGAAGLESEAGYSLAGEAGYLERGGAEFGGHSGIGNEAGAAQGGTPAGQGGLPDRVAGATAAGVGANAGAEDGGSAGDDSASLGEHCNGCTATVFGNPAWRVAGIASCAGTVGSTDTEMQPFLDFMTPIVAPTHVWYAAESLYGPGAPHSGPYLDENYNLLSNAGIVVKQSFTTPDFTAPSGVLLGFTIVPRPNAPIGSSADFSSGPIIPNGSFPFQTDGDLYRDGSIYDPNFGGPTYGYDQFQPPLAFDGASHVMLWMYENTSYVPDVDAPGSYDFKLLVTDSSGAGGWAIDIPFTVADVP